MLVLLLMALGVSLFTVKVTFRVEPQSTQADDGVQIRSIGGNFSDGYMEEWKFKGDGRPVICYTWKDGYRGGMSCF